MKGYDKYVKDVLSGKVVAGNLIKQACERFLSFKERDDIYFDAECVDDAIAFIKQIKHFLGKSANKPFILENWQQFMLANIIGLKYKDTGYRVCRETYIQVARKAGKDAFMGALALYFMIVDGEASPQIACLANTREQARILFEYIDTFAKGLDKGERLIKHYRNYITMPLNNGNVKVYSADAGSLDGLNVSLGVIDEFHEQKDRKLYDVIKSSMGMRTQPLMTVITTAGFNLDSPCMDMYKLGVEILGGVKTDDTFFPFIYQMDLDDDIDDEKNWIKCQPNLNITVSMEFMRSELQKLHNDITAEVGIKTKTFNMWCSSSQTWIRPESIVECMRPIKLEDYQGFTGVIGVDLGSVNDLTAISLMIPCGNERVFFNWSFLPEKSYEESPNKALYDKFIAEGSLILTVGNVADYDYISKKIQDINNIIPITEIFYDKYNSTQWVIQMTDLGFNMSPFSQAIGNYNAPTKEFERLVSTKEAIIEKSSNFLWQITCASIKEDHNGNRKPVKTAWRTQKIDNIIAATTALGGWMSKGGASFDFEIFSIM